jgi:hypothetical protein
LLAASSTWLVAAAGALTLLAAGAAAWLAGALSSPQPASEMAMASRLAEARGIRGMAESFAGESKHPRTRVQKPKHNAKDFHFAQRINAVFSPRAVGKVCERAIRYG